MPIATFKAICKLLPVTGIEVENNVRDFSVTMDAVAELGESDHEMHQFKMLLCSLGSCQAILTKAFAKANDIKRQDYWIELEGDLDTPCFL
ncbi:MAG: hypothetical protein JXA97_00235 [Anaerolineales bacterium]|nr:hypothetical protein [Anaerolineales bacterium]